MTADEDASPTVVAEERLSLERRVHVDLARIRVEDMVTTQPVDPPQDPEGGRNTDMEFMTRNGGW
jgi:hypothetical protein